MNYLSTLSSVTQRIGGRNLYLVGMMGSGKSSTGPFLANRLGYSFVDSDKVIEEITKKTISDLFHQDGEQIFRDIETQVLKEIGQRHSLVIATGGGVVIRSENWGILHQGIVIWMNPSKERILSRLSNDSGNRPLLKGSDSLISFNNLLKKRLHLYKEADLHINIDAQTAEQVSEEIIRQLPSIFNQEVSPDE